MKDAFATNIMVALSTGNYIRLLVWRRYIKGTQHSSSKPGVFFILLISSLVIVLVGIAFHATTAVASGFTLNWQQDRAAEGASFVSNDAYFCSGFSYMSCASGGGFGGGFGGGGNNDNTPFLQETLDLGGARYFHLIVGDYTTDSMALEVFIHVSSSNQSQDGIRFSDSLCNNCSQSRSFSTSDALNSNSNVNGNGGGNPNSVMMRQIVTGGAYDGEFLKDSFSQKPLIRSSVTTPDMVSTVSLDMRGSDYSQLAPIGLSDVTISQVMQGPDSFGTSGDFDISTHQVQDVQVTAGGFTYARGPSSSGGGGGTYTYFDGGGFNPLNFDYASFCDPTQNNTATSSGFGGFGGGGGTPCGK